MKNKEKKNKIINVSLLKSSCTNKNLSIKSFIVKKSEQTFRLNRAIDYLHCKSFV